ncbi:MAG: dehydrogenase, partial [Rhodospirillales bacterium]|nr:dehydrogenase [Rhodospirillales bacterium]
MKVLIVYAHPEPHSLNGALKAVAVSALQSAGHEVQVSDLYASGWKSEFDRPDFTTLSPDTRLHPVLASKEAFATGTQTPDIAAEQAKLLWADAVILQFPLWWYTMPAILKG